MTLDFETERIAKEIVDSACQVHTHFGPGMLENVYELAFFRKLEKKGLSPARQIPVPVEFEEEVFETAFRADIIVNNKILIELKACERILPVHRAQTLSYIRLSDLKLGWFVLLIKTLRLRVFAIQKKRMIYE